MNILKKFLILIAFIVITISGTTKRNNERLINSRKDACRTLGEGKIV